MVASELSVYSIRGLLCADVLADLLQFEPHRGYGITAGPEDARPVKLRSFAAQPRDGNRALFPSETQ